MLLSTRTKLFWIHQPDECRPRPVCVNRLLGEELPEEDLEVRWQRAVDDEVCRAGTNSKAISCRSCTVSDIFIILLICWQVVSPLKDRLNWMENSYKEKKTVLCFRSFSKSLHCLWIILCLNLEVEGVQGVRTKELYVHTRCSCGREALHRKMMAPCKLVSHFVVLVYRFVSYLRNTDFPPPPPRIFSSRISWVMHIDFRFMNYVWPAS